MFTGGREHQILLTLGRQVSVAHEEYGTSEWLFCLCHPLVTIKDVAHVCSCSHLNKYQSCDKHTEDIKMFCKRIG